MNVWLPSVVFGGQRSFPYSAHMPSNFGRKPTEQGLREKKRNEKRRRLLDGCAQSVAQLSSARRDSRQPRQVDVQQLRPNCLRVKGLRTVHPVVHRAIDQRVQADGKASHHHSLGQRCYSGSAASASGSPFKLAWAVPPTAASRQTHRPCFKYASKWRRASGQLLAQSRGGVRDTQPRWNSFSAAFKIWSRVTWASSLVHPAISNGVTNLFWDALRRQATHLHRSMWPNPNFFCRQLC